MSIAGIVRARTGVQALSPPAPQPPGTVEITDHDQTFAFTLPGRGGQVVLSTGLIDMLDEAEQQVVLAHERAHAHHRHDRYLLTAQLAAAVMPLLRPLAGRLQFSLERWADETAVARCGDRGFVARTLGKVALRRITPAGAAFERGIVPGSGTPAPLPEAGRLTELSADDFEGVLVGLRGTPVIVNIWASWCAPCRTETPLLERTWQPTAAKWSSSAWNPKTFFARSLFFMKEFGVTYPDCSFCLRARLAGIGRSVGAHRCHERGVAHGHCCREARSRGDRRPRLSHEYQRSPDHPERCGVLAGSGRWDRMDLPFAAIAAGVVSASSPFVLPVLPGYIAAISATDTDDGGRGPRRAVALGAAFARGWTPCIGPILATVFTKAAADASLVQGMFLLLLYSIGLGLPFIAVAIWFEKSQCPRQWMMRRSLLLQRIGGATKVAVGIGYVTGVWATIFTGLQGWLARTGWPPIRRCPQRVYDIV